MTTALFLMTTVLSWLLDKRRRTIHTYEYITIALIYNLITLQSVKASLCTICPNTNTIKESFRLNQVDSKGTTCQELSQEASLLVDGDMNELCTTKYQFLGHAYCGCDAIEPTTIPTDPKDEDYSDRSKGICSLCYDPTDEPIYDDATFELENDAITTCADAERYLYAYSIPADSWGCNKFQYYGTLNCGCPHKNTNPEDVVCPICQNPGERVSNPEQKVWGGPATCGEVEFMLAFDIDNAYTSRASCHSVQGYLKGTCDCEVVPTGTPIMATSFPTIPPTIERSSSPTSTTTKNPTIAPTMRPTIAPSHSPSTIPSSSPTISPTVIPTILSSTIPTGIPSATPTIEDSGIPSVLPSNVPTMNPNASPSWTPSMVPSSMPTMEDSVLPSSSPTELPSTNPHNSPSILPTKVSSTMPTIEYSDIPSALPTTTPTKNPTIAPTITPSQSPSKVPTSSPSIVLSAIPTIVSSSVPTVISSAPPTLEESGTPSALTSDSPTIGRSDIPSMSPTTIPTKKPTMAPTMRPTIKSSQSPSTIQSSSPTIFPTVIPTITLSSIPTEIASAPPTVEDSEIPSALPSHSPTMNPNTSQSWTPSMVPSMKHSLLPISSPTYVPVPSTNPHDSPSTTHSHDPSPTSAPTIIRSDLPSGSPSIKHSVSPTSSPTKEPSMEPTIEPTLEPTAQPTQYPSLLPTATKTLLTSAPTNRKYSGDITPQPTICADDPLFTFKEGTKSCESLYLVAESNYKKFCAWDNISEGCPLTCGSCCANDEDYSFADGLTCKSLGTVAAVDYDSFCSDSVTEKKCRLACGGCESPSTSPTDLPTINDRVTTTPSIQPTFFSSQSPSSSPVTKDVKDHPTFSPSNRPSIIPSTLQPTVCADDPLFTFKEGTKSCEYIYTVAASNQVKFCGWSKVSSHCPLACSKCCANDENYSFAGSQTCESLKTISSINYDSFCSDSVIRMKCRLACGGCDIPSGSPSMFPTDLPSVIPTDIPTITSSFNPSNHPTMVSSQEPSSTTSANPTTFPSVIPTILPSIDHSTSPTHIPTTIPSQAPTSLPTFGPSRTPTNHPTDVPTIKRSERPSTMPSIAPSAIPSEIPSRIPTRLLSIGPTNRPSPVTSIPSLTPSIISSTSPTSFLDSFRPNCTEIANGEGPIFADSQISAIDSTEFGYVADLYITDESSLDQIIILLQDNLSKIISCEATGCPWPVVRKRSTRRDSTSDSWITDYTLNSGKLIHHVKYDDLKSRDDKDGCFANKVIDGARCFSTEGSIKFSSTDVTSMLPSRRVLSDKSWEKTYTLKVMNEKIADETLQIDGLLGMDVYSASDLPSRGDNPNMITDSTTVIRNRSILSTTGMIGVAAGGFVVLVIAVIIILRKKQDLSDDERKLFPANGGIRSDDSISINLSDRDRVMHWDGSIQSSEESPSEMSGVSSSRPSNSVHLDDVSSHVGSVRRDDISISSSTATSGNYLPSSVLRDLLGNVYGVSSPAASEATVQL